MNHLVGILMLKLIFQIIQQKWTLKIFEIEGKIPDVSGLAAKTALTTVENKIPSVSTLVENRLMTNILILQSLIN